MSWASQPNNGSPGRLINGNKGRCDATVGDSSALTARLSYDLRRLHTVGAVLEAA
jgi:hypothetical protein